MFVPDYLFYRFATWFYRSDGPSGSRAVVVVSALYTVVVWTLSYCAFCAVMGGTVAGHSWLNKYSRLFLLYVMLLWCTISYLTHLHYRNSYERFVTRWKNDQSIEVVTKTAMAISSLVLIFSLCYKIARYLQF